MLTEEGLQLLADVIELAGLVAVLGLEAVAVNRIAAPHD